MMRETYKKLLAFLLLFLCVNTVLHFLYKKNVYYNTDNARKERQFNQYDGELRYLFLGDSHSQNSIDPSIVGRSFNFSSANENYIQTYYKLKSINDNLEKDPEYIVLPIDPSSFSSFRTSRFRNPSELLSFNDYLEVALFSKQITFLRVWMQNSFFMYAGNYTLINRFIKAKRDRTYSEMQLGFKGRPGDLSSLPDIEKPSRNTTKTYFYGHDYFDPILQDYFKRILLYCQQEGIAVYLMKMPLAKEFVEACATYFSTEEYYKDIYKMANDFSSVKYIFDYQNIYFEQPKYFRNPDHINIKGAKHFSALIKNEFANFENNEHPF